MLNSVVNFIEEIAEKDLNTYFVYIDGFQHPWVTNLKKMCPDRVISCGISEANAVSIATGLALSGKTVYVFMIAAYASRRALDQFKFAAYCNANVKIITALSGIAVPYAGYSHTAVDDVSILRNTPNLKIFKPSQKQEIKHILKNTYKEKGPCYIGIDNRGKEPNIQKTEYGKVSVSNSGNSQIGIFFTGFAGAFINLQDFLKEGINPSIYSVYSMEPFYEEEMTEIIKRHKCIVTVEFQGKGCLASSVAEIIAKNGIKTKFLPLYLKDEKYTTMGSADYAGEKYLSLSALVQNISDFAYFENKFFTRETNCFDNSKVKIKYKFLGITYLKIIKTPNRMKKYLLGFIKIK